ncbi:hypothetical protein [Burkholderia vietnamiensis]|nr:hypothetical protein [Burkholderia vietnamiensis]
MNHEIPLLLLVAAALAIATGTWMQIDKQSYFDWGWIPLSIFGALAGCFI